MEPLEIKNDIWIDAPIEQVWDALINPEKTKQYMFTCEVLSDWEIGSEVLWKGSADGIVYVKGTLVEFEEPHVFSFTTIDPNGDYPDIPENYLTVKYALVDEGERVHLIVTQGDYNQAADGQARYEDTIKGGGWEPVLQAIKDLVEK